MDLLWNSLRFLRSRFVPTSEHKHKGAIAVKNPSIYLKMKVLGAIDVAPGKTRDERVRNVAEMTFLDEEANQYRFTWRTIQTWYYRYKNHGVTAMDTSSRADKGMPRKVTPEEVLEAINQALPHFRQKSNGHSATPNKTAIYQFCIEKGLLHASQIARTTFASCGTRQSVMRLRRGRSNASFAKFAINSSFAISICPRSMDSIASSPIGSNRITTPQATRRLE